MDSTTKTLLIIFGSIFGIGLVLTNRLENIDLVHEKEFLGAILTAGAAILAIAFSVSQFIVSRISDIYSPYIVKYHNDSPLTKLAFFSFLITIGISSILLGTDFSFTGKIFHPLIIWYILCIFIASLGFFTKYFFKTMEFINPLNFAEIIKNKIIDVMKRIPYNEFIKNDISKIYENNFNSFNDLIGSIGDTSIKLLIRNEIRISILYLGTLEDIAIEFLKVQYGQEVSLLDNKFETYNNKELSHHPVFLILNQLERVFKIAYKEKEYDITNKILAIGENIISYALKNNNSDYVIKFFTYNQGISPFFYHIQNILSGDKDDREEKPHFILTLLRLVNQCKNVKETNSRYIDYFLPTFLFDILKIIIDNDDFVSYRYFVEHSVIFIQGDPDTFEFLIGNELNLKTNNEEINKIIDELDLLNDLQLSCQTNIGSIRLFIPKLIEYAKKISSSSIHVEKSSLDELIERLISRSWMFYVHSLCYKAVFWIGAYILFKKMEIKYLDLLWNVNTSNENRGIYGNRPLISENTKWNTLLYFYENHKQVVLNFDLFRDPYFFLEKFYLMTLIRNNHDFLFPAEPAIKQFFANKKNDVILEWLDVCKTIQNYKLDEKIIQSNFEHIDKILNTKSQIMIPQQINALQKEAKNCIRLINKYIELSPSKVILLTTLIYDKYSKYSSIDRVSEVSYSEKRTSKFSTFITPSQIDKERLWDLITYDQLDDYSAVMVQLLLEFERSVLINTLQHEKRLPKIQCTLSNLISNIEIEYSKMKAKGSKPDCIFLSYGLQFRLSTILQTELSGYLNIRGENIMIVSNNKLNNEIYLVPKSSLITTYKEYDNRKLQVGIWKDEQDLEKAIVQPLISLQTSIKSPKSIRKFVIT